MPAAPQPAKPYGVVDLPLVQTLRRPVFQAGAQGETTRSQDFLDLVEATCDPGSGSSAARSRCAGSGRRCSRCSRPSGSWPNAPSAPARPPGAAGSGRSCVGRLAGWSTGITDLGWPSSWANTASCSTRILAEATDRFLRRDRAVGLDLHDQLVQVGTLLDAGVLDRVAHAA